MTDKINGQGYRPVDVAGNARRLGGAGANEGEGNSNPTAATGEQVSLTRSAVLLGRLEEALASVPVVNDARVDAIRQAVDSGAYEIDAEAIADQIIRLEQDIV